MLNMLNVLILGITGAILAGALAGIILAYMIADKVKTKKKQAAKEVKQAPKLSEWKEEKLVSIKKELKRREVHARKESTRKEIKTNIKEDDMTM